MALIIKVILESDDLVDVSVDGTNHLVPDIPTVFDSSWGWL